MVEGCTIIDLNKFNEIKDFESFSGTIKIGAGVTQKQLYKYLENQSIDYFINITGSTEDSSVIGNIADKGVGHYGLRQSDVISLKVLLGTGEIIDCGGDSVLGSLSSSSYAPGLGPDIKGLFLQSNLGIILEATIELIPKNSDITVVNFVKHDGVTLERFVNTLASLRKSNILPSNIHISNRNRKLSVLSILLAKFRKTSIKDTQQAIQEKYSSEYFAMASLNHDSRILETYKALTTEALEINSTRFNNC